MFSVKFKMHLPREPQLGTVEIKDIGETCGEVQHTIECLPGSIMAKMLYSKVFVPSWDAMDMHY